MTSKEIVLKFWELMQSNNFYQATEVFSDDFQCFWPQSSELIIGSKNFTKINTEYPVKGKWDFKLNNILEDGNQVVTDVSVSDESIQARVISFFTIKNNRIQKIVEFWPDDFEAPEWRSRWVEIITSS